MPVTYLQTVDISYKGANKPVKGMDNCPIAEVGTIGYRKLDGSTILWLEESAIQWFSNGTIKTWLKKPTIKEAFNSKPVGGYWEFKNDGRVYARINGEFYYWSEPIEGLYETGSKINVHVCPCAQGQYFFDDEICFCYLCIYCESKMDCDNKFCSRSCQIAFSSNDFY
jgi:hypothetical protein